MEQGQGINVLTQYANIIIPLVISIMGGIVTFQILKEKVKRLEEDVKDIKKEKRELRDKIIACETSLKEREPLVKRKSPISLTDRGKEILEKSGGKKYIDDNFESLSVKVEEKQPKTPYDVQEISKSVMDNEKESEGFNPLKEYLFKEGLDIEDLLIVTGIYLRDKVLDAKKWDVKDIDKYEKRESSNSSQK